MLDQDEIDELRQIAFLLTRMFKQVAPFINEGKTFDILVDFFNRNATEASAVRCGKKIRDTMTAAKGLN